MNSLDFEVKGSKVKVMTGPKMVKMAEALGRCVLCKALLSIRTLECILFYFTRIFCEYAIPHCAAHVHYQFVPFKYNILLY